MTASAIRSEATAVSVRSNTSNSEPSDRITTPSALKTADIVRALTFEPDPLPEDVDFIRFGASLQQQWQRPVPSPEQQMSAPMHSPSVSQGEQGETS